MHVFLARMWTAFVLNARFLGQDVDGLHVIFIKQSADLV
jgi:hypothetical protein